MPEVTGVACGAILSNYQRVRVEHVCVASSASPAPVRAITCPELITSLRLVLRRCSRLGLTPIAYLWERDQKELLGEMVAAGMESVLVKVAGAG